MEDDRDDAERTGDAIREHLEGLGIDTSTVWVRSRSVSYPSDSCLQVEEVVQFTTGALSMSKSGGIMVVTAPPAATEKRTLDTVMPSAFRPGLYEHYKGGFYTALHLVWMNELREERVLGVLYLSLEKREYNTRPFNDAAYDSWSDDVCVNGEWKSRFQYVSQDELHELVTEVNSGKDNA